MAERSADVLVLGAGPAGLAAANACLEGGLSVILLEQDEQVGGLSQTCRWGDFRYDIGGHRFFTRDQALEDWVRDLLAGDLLTVPRHSRLYSQGVFFNYPLEARDALKKMSIGELLAAGMGYMSARLGARFAGPAESFEEWTRRAFGGPVYRRFFREYTAKIWGIPPTEISPEWASQRIRSLNLLRAGLDALGLLKKTPRSLVHEFLYPREGFGQIWDLLADRICEAGGHIETGRRVTGFRTDEGGIRSVLTRRTDGTEERWSAGQVIATLPMPELATALVPDLATQAARLRFRGLITVLLVADRAPLVPDHWLYFPDGEVPFGRLHEPTNWSAALSPPGRSSLVVEWFADPGDPTWQRSDGDLISTSIEWLEGRIGLLPPGTLQPGEVRRWPQAYPIYNLGYAEPATALRKALATVPNLILAGRGGQFRYHNADHAILTGHLAAKKAQGRPADPFDVNIEEDYLEEK